MIIYDFLGPFEPQICCHLPFNVHHNMCLLLSDTSWGHMLNVRPVLYLLRHIGLKRSTIIHFIISFLIVSTSQIYKLSQFLTHLGLRAVLSISTVSGILSLNAPSSTPCSLKALPKKRGHPRTAARVSQSDRRALVAKQQKQTDGLKSDNCTTIG
jgi:hypothetical protein